MVESINGLYKTELIRRFGPWRNVDAVQIATGDWVDWYNHRRPNEYAGGDLTPVETENTYYDQTATPAAS